MIDAKILKDRFLRYVAMDTCSNDESETCPSTEKQLNLAKLLEAELCEMGLEEVTLDENGYVMGTLPANTEKNISTIGFIAHYDTSPDMSGENVKPQVIEKYDGCDIILNEELGIILSTADFPEMKNYVGQTLITTDGTTLLGADDKAGIAEILTGVKYLQEHPEIKHGKIRVGFTPDEEIGRGANKFDVEKFNADFAYTLDGGEIGQLEFENFNAAQAKITIQGCNVHPGTAKDKMLNAILVASELNDMLPHQERPEHTENYEGFYHIVKLDGTVEKTSMVYIIRDHDMEKFEKKKAYIKEICDFLNKKYREGTVTLELKDQYFNMREKIKANFHIVETAKKAMEKVGVKPLIVPIRGGTDGARLSFKGLPCPNIFTGGHNFHGKFEYIPLESMQKSVETMIKIVELYAEM